MIFGRTALKLALSRLRDERRRRVKAEAEAERWRVLYEAKCEYIVVSKRGPRFDIVEKHEPKSQVSQFRSFAEIERSNLQNHDADFAAYLDAHPEELNQSH